MLSNLKDGAAAPLECDMQNIRDITATVSVLTVTLVLGVVLVAELATSLRPPIL